MIALSCSLMKWLFVLLDMVSEWGSLLPLGALLTNLCLFVSVGRQGWPSSLLRPTSSGPGLVVLYKLAFIPLHHWTVLLRWYTVISKAHLLEHYSTLYDIPLINDNFCHSWNREHYYLQFLLSEVFTVHFLPFTAVRCYKSHFIKICHSYLGAIAEVRAALEHRWLLLLLDIASVIYGWGLLMIHCQ